MHPFASGDPGLARFGLFEYAGGKANVKRQSSELVESTPPTCFTNGKDFTADLCVAGVPKAEQGSHAPSGPTHGGHGKAKGQWKILFVRPEEQNARHKGLLLTGAF